MIYNFPQIRKLLNFKDPGDFYFIEILEISDSVNIKTYHIYSISEFDSIQDDIINTCEAKNARAYIRMNTRNSKVIALSLIKRLADLVQSGQTDRSEDLYNTVCKETRIETDTNWIIRVDNRNDEVYAKQVLEDLWNQMLYGGIILSEIDTVTGKDLITTYFNIEKFKQSCPKINVDTDASTLIFSPTTK